MKPSVIQTPRRTTPSAASHGGRARETPPPSKHQVKMVSKSLNSDFSVVPEEMSTESDDLFESSADASSTVEDFAEVNSFLFKELPVSESDHSVFSTHKDPISPRPLPMVDDYGSRRSVEIAVRKAAAAGEMMDRLREALLEMRKSTEVSGGSKRLLSALVEVAIGDVGCDPWVEDGGRDSVFWGKFRIGIVCFLILFVAMMNFLVVTALMNGRGRGDLTGLATPT